MFCCKTALFVPHCLQTSAKGSYRSWIHLTGNCPGCWLHSRRYIKFDTFHPAVSKGLPVTRVISRITLQVRTAGRAFCSWCSLCSKKSVIAAFWQQPWRSAWSLQGQQRSRQCMRLAVQMAQRRLLVSVPLSSDSQWSSAWRLRRRPACVVTTGSTARSTSFVEAVLLWAWGSSLDRTLFGNLQQQIVHAPTQRQQGHSVKRPQPASSK